MMFSFGARNISFISRSGATSTEAKRLLESLQVRGCNAQAYACDITDAAAVEAFAKDTIKGVVQCAMVLRDRMFDNMTFKQWTQSLAPKVQGTWHLHGFLPVDMDFFIMLSSMAGIIGNPGQANYSAAGTYQDALERLAYLENLFISERHVHLIVSAAMLGQTRDGHPVPSQLVIGVGKELLAGGSIGTAMSFCS